MNKKTICAAFSLLMLTILSFSAQAHTGLGSIYSFSNGFAHPWLGIDHVLVITAIGLWASVSGGKSLWVLPVAFLLAMAIGAILYIAGVTIIGMEMWVVLSVLIVGLVLSMNKPISPLIATGLVVAFALGHGYVHAAEMSHGVGRESYIFGFLLATLTLQGIGMLAGCFGPLALQSVRIKFAQLCSLLGIVLLVGF